MDLAVHNQFIKLYPQTILIPAVHSSQSTMCYTIYGNAIYGNAIYGIVIYSNAIYGNVIYGNAIYGNVCTHTIRGGGR